MKKASNESLLRRRLRQHCFPLNSHWKPSELDELIELTILGLAQLPPSSAPSLRSRYSDLFCPFCGFLHPLASCTSPGVVDYRLDPHSWMRAHIPAGLMQQMATVKVKAKSRLPVQKLNKKQEEEEYTEKQGKIPIHTTERCPLCQALIQIDQDGNSIGHKSGCQNNL